LTETVREIAREHGRDLPGFLRRTALSGREGGGGPKAEKVRLLTFHAAKGLEFPVVFLAGAEEGIAPLAGADPQEERRLFYVALTRARDRLFLSHSEERRIFGRLQAMKASRFLSDIPDGCLQRSAFHPARKSRDRSGGQLPLF
jgi:DNA helicase II / ATP-dependent DNA helicase PcrA